MANAIKIGEIAIQIVEDIEITGSIINHPVLTSSLTLEQTFENGSDIGGGQDNYKDSYEIDCATLVKYATTDCNGAKVIVYPPVVEITDHHQTAWYTDIHISAGSPLVDIDTAIIHWPLINVGPFLVNIGYMRYTRWSAIRYRYTDQTEPNLKRYGYYIVQTQKNIVYNTSTQAVTVNYNRIGGFWLDFPRYNSLYGTDYFIDEIPDPGPEDPFDPSSPTPYNPDGDDTSDLIDLPTDPPFGITSAGFINVYKPSAGGLQGLGEVIFPASRTPTDVSDAISMLVDTIANQNLINYVIDCHIIPVSPVVGNTAEIKVGYRTTGIFAPAVTSDYVNVSCGSLSLAEYYGGFQDYQCTVSKLFLPFIGFVDVIPEFWQAGTISVDYKFNIIDGSFMAFVRSVSSKSNLNGSVIAAYSGNACMHLPLTGLNYATMVNGLINAGAAASGGGGAGAIFGSALSALNIVAKGADVQQSNGYNATASILGVRTPYLQIERLKPAWSTKYRHDKGLPSNIATPLQNISGFTVIEDIDLTGLPFTLGEIEELRGLLKDGAYF